MLRAITICVNYQDLLSISLPYNLHHFDEMWIVTDSKCYEQVNLVCCGQPREDWDKLKVIQTDLFYQDNAKFNKFRALEYGLDQMGRHGWVCIMDCDVLWPKEMSWHTHPQGLQLIKEIDKDKCSSNLLTTGNLYGPLRHMMPTKDYLTHGLPPENDWSKYPIHRNIHEWVGYTQIFNASDPHLGDAPWHDTRWTHAGGGDSFFQAKWPAKNKIRLPFNVLHIGEAGTNWMGRASQYLDGSVPENAKELNDTMQAMWNARHKAGRGKFEQEKIK